MRPDLNDKRLRQIGAVIAAAPIGVHGTMWISPAEGGCWVAGFRGDKDKVVRVLTEVGLRVEPSAALVQGASAEDVIEKFGDRVLFVYLD